ncbi:hypothetical protein HHK36_021695 [Tetracentron sinense]|uniref:Auxin-responsive protein n=1 Tax=Tetracentron sinense TaxID=13715 RepID=A0A835D829_TETSI|nr:hypothetical protein HHK36_021695 [Tetracentron sinense]
MEGCSRNGDICPQLLDLIPNGREWIVRRDGGSLGASEEKKLELRLGPPVEDWFIKENSKNNSRDRDESLLSFRCFSSMASRIHNSNNNTSGAKRGFLDTVETKGGEETWLINSNGNQNHKLSSSDKLAGAVFSSPWCSGTLNSPSSSAYQMKTQQQQQPNPSFLQCLSIPQTLPVIAKESSQPCSNKVGDLQNPEKKTCCTASANTAVPNSSQKRTAPAPVVGWPPIRSFRKNLASSSSSKPAPELQSVVPTEAASGKSESCGKGLFVKINMDGVPIGRKVDLKAYNSYEKLSSAVDELFRGLLAAQRDSSAAGNQNKKEEVTGITGLLDGSGEYTLVYEDNEGDRMLAGDVPWHMFVSTVKRLRLLKSSELPALRLGSNKQEKASVDSVK